MADPENENKKHGENKADDADFLNDELDELSAFGGDDLADPSDSAIDDLLGGEIEPLDEFVPTPAATPIEPTPIPDEPIEDPGTVAGNQRLEGSQRRRRERPRPRREAAPSEDDIIFDDDDFVPTLPDEIPVIEPEPVVVPPEPVLEEEIPAIYPEIEDIPPIPEPAPFPEAPPSAFDPTPIPVEEPEIEPAPEPIPAELPEVEILESAPIGLGAIDDDFEDLPDVPELDLEAPAPVIDPTPVPDLDAIGDLPPPVEADFPGDDELMPPPISVDDEALPGTAVELEDEPLEEAGAAPAQSAAQAPVSAFKHWLGNLKALELASLAVLLLSCIIGTYLFSSWAKKGRPDREVAPKPLSEPPASIAGEVAKIGSLQAYWRKKTDEDSDKIESEYLPVVSVTLDGGGDGYLLAVFYDSMNKIAGTADGKISNGKFVSNDSPTGLLTCTEGLPNIFELSTYQAEEERRWRVVLKESTNKDDYKDLANFTFPGELR